MHYVILFIGLTFSQALSAEKFNIAAAASLQFALNEIAEQFQQQHPHQPKISFASSGTLSHQIEQGAPFEIFFSADKFHTQRLVKKNLGAEQSDNNRCYARGQLAIIYPTISTSLARADLSTLKERLAENTMAHFSIPNPQLAPYGRVAKQALENSQLWSPLSDHLVIGENAAQSAMYISRGAVDAAIIPLSLAMILAEKNLGQYARLQTFLYTPLDQHVLLLRNASPAAQQFYDYIFSAEAQQIFSQHGFESVLN